MTSFAFWKASALSLEQNASTSPGETIYELMVPIDEPEILSQALNILAEFSTEVGDSRT